MKKKWMYLISAILVLGCACSRQGAEPVKNPDVPWPGDEDCIINPDQTKLFFTSKNDTIIVNTENDYWELYLYYGREGYFPRNPTRDTVQHGWIKLVALEPRFLYDSYNSEKKIIGINSKCLKVIVFDNDTGKRREGRISLDAGNSRVFIDIEQEGE